VLKKLGSLAATSFQLCDFMCVKKETKKWRDNDERKENEERKTYKRDTTKKIEGVVANDLDPGWNSYSKYFNILQA
jgi:hypothetical protein